MCRRRTWREDISWSRLLLARSSVTLTSIINVSRYKAFSFLEFLALRPYLFFSFRVKARGNRGGNVTAIKCNGNGKKVDKFVLNRTWYVFVPISNLFCVLLKYVWCKHECGNLLATMAYNASMLLITRLKQPRKCKFCCWLPLNPKPKFP